MAQLGSAQREPSMEEILASIRRIIEDSDPVRRVSDETPSVRPDNDVASSVVTASVAPATGIEKASVVEVGAFRAGLRAEGEAVVAPEPQRPLSRPDIHELVEADRIAAREAAERDYAFAAQTPATEPASTQHAPEKAQQVEDVIPSVTDWGLGVPEAEHNEVHDFDLDEVADAVLQDIAAAQAKPDEEREEGVAAPAVVAESQRPAIISDHTGRQVAAAFSELSEALAARNRKSLDEMAEEMLRPMLQDWLDNNLPTLVERLVREEIERVARGS